MTEKEARKAIKKHLRRRGNEPIELTVKVVRYWWNLLNAAVFEGTLKPAKRIKIFEHQDEHAWAIPERNRRVSISMHPSFVSRELFLTILVHEMVHAWEFQKYALMGHGKRFFSWEDKIKDATTLILKQEINEDDYGIRPS